jgi:MFS family permease
VLALNYTVLSVAYTLAVSPAGYIAEQGYGLLAASSASGYLLVAALYLFGLRGPLTIEASRSETSFLREALCVARDGAFLGFASVAFVFPFSMGLVVVASPLFATESGLGEGFVGLVLGLNSIIVALLAVPVAARMEASGPFRALGGAAVLVAACFACYAWIPDARAALIAGTVVFSFGELVFSSAVPAAVARLAPEGRRGAYQGAWTLVASFSMGSALFFSGVLRDAIGWRAAWAAYALIAAGGAVLLLAWRRRLERPGER